MACGNSLQTSKYPVYTHVRVVFYITFAYSLSMMFSLQTLNTFYTPTGCLLWPVCAGVGIARPRAEFSFVNKQIANKFKICIVQ